VNAPPDNSSMVGNRDAISSSAGSAAGGGENSKAGAEEVGSLTKGSDEGGERIGWGLGVDLFGRPRLMGSTGRELALGWYGVGITMGAEGGGDAMGDAAGTDET
jgi:hypothetical protein